MMQSRFAYLRRMYVCVYVCKVHAYSKDIHRVGKRAAVHAVNGSRSGKSGGLSLAPRTQDVWLDLVGYVTFNRPHRVSINSIITFSYLPRRGLKFFQSSSRDGRVGGKRLPTVFRVPEERVQCRRSTVHSLPVTGSEWVGGETDVPACSDVGAHACVRKALT